MAEIPSGSTRRRSNLPYRIVVLVSVLLVVAVVLVVAYVSIMIWTQSQARRDRAIPIIAAEFAGLPPPGGVSQAQRIVTTDPGRGPDILVVYPQVVSCDDVQAHYAQLSLAEGWQAAGTQHLGYDIIDRYSKTVSGYDLVMAVDCKDDDPAGGPYSGYTLDIHG